MAQPSTKSVLFGALVSFMTACHHPAPPPRWEQGGARLVLPEATWSLDGGTVELSRSGKVFFDGQLGFVIDRVGRVVNDSYEPVALLMPDGVLVGTDDTDLGRIGLRNGAPPHSETAWFSLSPSGEVTFYDRDGERHPSGTWEGCEPPRTRACTLATQIAFLRAARRPRWRTTGFGFGLGYWR